MTTDKQWYEFQLGVYVEAESEDQAFHKISPLLRKAEGLDVEGDVPCEIVATWPVGGPKPGSNFKGAS